MSEYVTYLDGGRTNAEGLYKFLNRLFTAGVPTAFSATSLQATQRGAGANLSVDIAVGDVMLNMPTNAYALWGYTDAVKNVVISTANATNPRIDAIVVYADATAFTAGSSNNPGALKFIAVAGTPSGTPAAPSTSTIQTAIGGTTIPYQILANVAVAANTTSITNANISDLRTSLLPSFIVPAQNLSPSAITLAYVPLTAGYSNNTSAPIQIPGLTATVTIPAGGRKVRITAFVSGAYTTGATGDIDVCIWDGTVGSGTQLQHGHSAGAPLSNPNTIIAQAIVTPAAGSKTYNVSVNLNGGSGGTYNLQGATTNPMYLLVEAI